ncbi:MAG: phosphoribosylanthranilate isomerase [Nevskia sp.]|nr:phosphoribosylanthranilate isomerase [Nevskia sp.]
MNDVPNPESQLRLHRTRIKFCGITRLQDGLAAAALGVDALGFVFAAGSPRRIDAEAAAAIRRRLPPFVAAVALLRDADEATVRRVIGQLRPDLLQFHGDETAAFCGSFGLPYLKAVGMRGLERPLAAVAAEFAGAAGLLLDGHGAGEPGGQGRSFDWRRAALDCGVPLILAGGLHAGNVADAVRQARPYGVDVSGGIESAPGIKDSGRMCAFVGAVRRADADCSDACADDLPEPA